MDTFSTLSVEDIEWLFLTYLELGKSEFNALMTRWIRYGDSVAHVSLLRVGKRCLLAKYSKMGLEK